MRKIFLTKIISAIAAGLLLGGTCCVSGAQERPKNLIQSLKQISKPLQEKDQEDILDTARSMQEQNQESSLGLSPEAANMFRGLKNPFLAQLPQKVAPEPEPSPLEPDQPHPAPVNQIPQPSKPELKISGLVWNTPKPQAIINGQIVAVGDSVGGWDITAISENGVAIQNGNKKFIIEQEHTLASQITPEDTNSANRKKRNSIQKNLISVGAAPKKQTPQRRSSTQSFQYKQPKGYQ